MSGRSEKIRKNAKRSEKFRPTLRLEGEIPDRRQHEWEDKGGGDYWEIFNMSHHELRSPPVMKITPFCSTF